MLQCGLCLKSSELISLNTATNKILLSNYIFLNLALIVRLRWKQGFRTLSQFDSLFAVFDGQSHVCIAKQSNHCWRAAACQHNTTTTTRSADMSLGRHHPSKHAKAIACHRLLRQIPNSPRSRDWKPFARTGGTTPISNKNSQSMTCFQQQ